MQHFCKTIFSLSRHPLIVWTSEFASFSRFSKRKCSESSWEMLTPTVLQRSVVFFNFRAVYSLPRDIHCQRFFGLWWLGGVLLASCGRGQSDSGRTDPTTNELSDPATAMLMRENIPWVLRVSVWICIVLHGDGVLFVRFCGHYWGTLISRQGLWAQRSFKTKS